MSGIRLARPWLAIALAALTCAAVGAGAGQPAILVSSTCSAATPADSAQEAVRDAIRATMTTAAAAAGVPDPHGLVVIMMDRDGADPVFRMVEGDLPDAALALAAPHVAGLAAAWPGEGRIRLVVRLDPLPLPACRPGRVRRRTDPRFVRPDEGREVLCQLGRRHAGSRVGLGQLVLWFALARDGRIAYAEIETGEGGLIREGELLAPLGTLEMRPPTLDGVPQDQVFATQLLVRVRPEGRGPRRSPERVSGSTPMPLWDASRDPSGCG